MDTFYIGQKEVKQFSVNEEVNLVGVLLADDSEMNLTISQWESLKSLEAYSENEVSDRKFAKAIQGVKESLLLSVDEASNKILDIFIEERATVTDYGWILKRVEMDFQPTLQRIETVLGNAFRRVVGEKFGVIDSSMILVSQLHEEMMNLKKEVSVEEMATGGEKH